MISKSPYENIPFAHSRFYYKIIHFHTLLNDGQNGTRSSQSNGNDNECEYNFLIICKYLNLVKNKRIILRQTENSQVVTTLTFSTDFGKYICYYYLTCLHTLKGNNSY